MATATALHPSYSNAPPVPVGQEHHPSLPNPNTLDAASTTATTPSDDSVPRGPVQATLNFFAPPADGATPFNYVEQPPAGSPKFNFGTATHDVPIRDARGQEPSFDLATHAFALLQNQPDTNIDWTDDAAITGTYYPEVTALLQRACPTATKIILFDHTIRRATPNSAREPVLRAHIDQTPKSAAGRVRRHVEDPAAAERYLQGRYRIINVWRPLNGAVESSPLAFADSSSVAADEVVPVEHRYPTWTGETAGVRYGEGQRWYYWSGCKGDERVLLQCFDSEGGARVPHTAFKDERGRKPRESIEVRALVLG